MTRLLTLAVLLSAFFFTLSSGTYCYGIADSIKKGQQCAGGAADCQYGTYCDDSGVCSPLLDIGTACLFDRDCVAGAYCQGKNGEKICVGIAGIGETCSTDAESTKARCFDDADPHTEDLCDLTAKVCLGGRLGDTCKHNSNVNVCLGLMKCTDGVCAGIAEGGNCTSTSECLPTLFCNHASPRICQQRKQGNVGGECDDNNECVPGSYCIGPGQTRCVTEKSVKVGEFCDNQNAVCESLRCAGESCAAGSPTYVEDPYCSEREVMTCGGLMIDNGAAATCTNNPCYDLEKTFGDCIQENCQQCSDARCTDYIIDTTPGRCYMNHCDKEFSNMRACNGAGQLIGSVFVAAFVAFLASFVSKKF